MIEWIKKGKVMTTKGGLPILCRQCPCKCGYSVKPQVTFPMHEHVSLDLPAFFPGNVDWTKHGSGYDCASHTWTSAEPTASEQCNCTLPSANWVFTYFPLPDHDCDAYSETWRGVCTDGDNGTIPAQHFMLTCKDLPPNVAFLKNGDKYYYPVASGKTGYRMYSFEYVEYTYYVGGIAYVGHQVVPDAEGAFIVTETIYTEDDKVCSSKQHALMIPQNGLSFCRNTPEHCEDETCATIWEDLNTDELTWLCGIGIYDKDTDELIEVFPESQMEIFFDERTSLTEEQLAELSCELCEPGYTLFIYRTEEHSEILNQYLWYYKCFSDPDNKYLNATLRPFGKVEHSEEIKDEDGTVCGTFVAYTDDYYIAATEVTIHSTYKESACDDHTGTVPDKGCTNVSRFKCEGGEVTVSASDCGCPEDGTSIEIDTAGTYSFTYKSGATRSNTADKWNATLSGGACSLGTRHVIYLRDSLGNTAMLPGFGAGWDTASEAEAANIGESISVELAEGTVWLGYNDFICEDNEGSITYTYKRIG